MARGYPHIRHRRLGRTRVRPGLIKWKGQELTANKRVREALRDDLAAYNDENPGSSARIGRVLMLTEPPLIDANEIPNKGYIDQRAVLQRRASLVETLSGDDPEVVLIP